jgi:hypothetical protein
MRSVPLTARLTCAAVVLAAAAVPSPGAGPDADVRRLITQMGNDSFPERENASRALDALGEAALPALRRALTHEDVEIRLRAGRLVEAIEARVVPRLREEAAAAVKALGGRVEVDAARPGAPVEGVLLSGAGVTDADLARLARLPGLAGIKALHLDNTRVTDTGLAHLGSFRGLRSLSLGGTAVTGAGLARLKGLDLETLSLDDTKVRGGDLAHLRDLTSLRNLSLVGTPVTDDGLAHLKGLTDLGSLDLRNTPVTNRGLDHLNGLKNLHTLSVRGTRATGAAAR